MVRDDPTHGPSAAGVDERKGRSEENQERRWSINTRNWKEGADPSKLKIDRSTENATRMQLRRRSIVAFSESSRINRVAEEIPIHHSTKFTRAGGESRPFVPEDKSGMN